MKEIASIRISIIEDRGIKKYKINYYKSGKYFGMIRPISL